MTSTVSWIGRPSPAVHASQADDSPTPQNPALRGRLLYYLTQVLASSAYVQSIFYANAGFSKLRTHPALRLVAPRYDPTVIKTNGKPAKEFGEILKELLKEDFSSRTPAFKTYPSSLDYHEAYKAGRLTPSDVVEALLPLILRDVKGASSHSVAFLETRVDLVRQAAEKSTLRYKAGKYLSPLDGVPVAVKDEVDLQGYRRCLGSKTDAKHKDDITTQCILPWEEAGAIVIGKLNMHEFGLDTTSLNPTHGTPLNPHNSDYFTGGSSGGSGYTIAAGIVPIAHGADGGGSIRIPSCFCGIYGLKPSHNRVSGRPTPTMAPSVGVHGPMAATMVDLELAYRTMARPDVLDPVASRFVPPASTTSIKDRKKLLGIDRAWFDRADPVVRDSCQRAVDWLVINLGYEVVEITLPILHEAQLAHGLTIVNEVISDIPDVSQLTAPNQILAHAVAAQTSGIDFLFAQKARTVLMEHMAHLYSRFPGMIVVSPTTPMAGWKITPGDLTFGTSNGNMTTKSMTYVTVANFTGLPAISAPVGYSEEKGGALPIGFMGMGEWCSEDQLLAFGYDCEQYLNEGVEGGRRLPATWVDVFDLAAKRKTA